MQQKKKHFDLIQTKKVKKKENKKIFDEKTEKNRGKIEKQFMKKLRKVKKKNEKKNHQK